MATLTSSEYWDDRTSSIMKSLDKLDAKESQKLFSYYMDTSMKIGDKVMGIYEKYADENGLTYEQARQAITKRDLTNYAKEAAEYRRSVVKDPELLKRLNANKLSADANVLELLQANIHFEMAKATKHYQDDFESYLKNVTNYSSKRIAEGYTQPTLNKAGVEAVIKSKWFGGNYSSRLWKNGDAMAEQLQHTLLDGFTYGRNPKVMAKDMRRFVRGANNDMKKMKYVTERLVRTESAYVANMAILDRYKHDGVEKYEFLAHIDKRTSNICRSMNHEEYSIKKYAPGVNAPPMHAHCRSRIAPADSELSKYDKYLNPNKKPQGAKTKPKSTPKAKTPTTNPFKDRVDAMDLSKASKDDIISLGKDFNNKYHVDKMLGDKAKLKETFGEVVDMGGEIPKTTWWKSSKAAVKKQLNEAFSNYPKHWVDYITNNNDKLLAGQTGRGFFMSEISDAKARHYLKGASAGDGVSIYVSPGRVTTPYHEIGHLVDHYNSDLVRIEKEFVESRTKNEQPTEMKWLFPGWGYRVGERTLKDNFITPYIGKTYDDATEVLSIGLESIFEPGMGQAQSAADGETIYKKITDDPEYLNLVIGLLLKG